jgi:citrate lyase subunit beta / citryl-CoA lyase
MKPYRTVLSVPGHKPSWFDKAVTSGADCLCLDLEDSVPEADKDTARQGIAEAIGRISRSNPRVGLFVRPNALDTGQTGDDLAAVIVPGLTGVFAPKVGSAVDVHKYDALVDYFERRNKVTGIEYILPIETIEGIQHCEEIGHASARVGALIGPTAEHADIARAIGYEWTPEGNESRYHRSRILLAARAAGVHPLTALWERIRDLDGLERFSVENRKMGFRGQVVLHPSHVPVVNKAYTASPADVDFYRGLLKAYEDAAARGEGAVMYGDIHIDKAHADKAQEWLRRVDALADLHGGL